VPRHVDGLLKFNSSAKFVASRQHHQIQHANEGIWPGSRFELFPIDHEPKALQYDFPRFLRISVEDSTDGRACAWYTAADR
jgi:hypothetical protein